MRCYICDYSETGESDIALDFSNKVVYDISVGKFICTDCQGHVFVTLSEWEDDDEFGPESKD